MTALMASAAMRYQKVEALLDMLFQKKIRKNRLKPTTARYELFRPSVAFAFCICQSWVVSDKASENMVNDTNICCVKKYVLFLSPG